MAPVKYAFLDDKIVPWDEARIHVATPAVRYGAGVFEGLRGYWNADQKELFVFRMAEHMRRLEFSQVAMRFDPIIDVDWIAEKTVELLRANEFRENVHIVTTPYVIGPGDPGTRGPIGLFITAQPRKGDDERVAKGVTAQVSSWMRVPDNAMPMRVKCNANYNNGRFATIQARLDGYDTAIFLNSRGKLAEGPGMCFFMVRDGVPVTPSRTSDILESITRQTVIEIFREYMGLETVERDIDRSELFAAEEAFFCGTAWEVTPISAIDRQPIGGGKTGPVTRKLQELYFGLACGTMKDHPEWRLPVYGKAAAKAAE